MPNNEAKDEGGTRDRLVKATIELIAEAGADRVRTRAVAERAGVNPALVHYHFGSVPALIDEAVETAMAQEMQPFVEALSRGGSLRAALEALFDAIQGVGEPTLGVLVSIDLLARATRDPKTRARWLGMLEEFRGMFAERLEQARGSGEIDQKVDVSAVAALIAALFDGLVVHRLIDRDMELRTVTAPLMSSLFGSRRMKSAGKGGK